MPVIKIQDPFPAALFDRHDATVVFGFQERTVEHLFGFVLDRFSINRRGLFVRCIQSECVAIDRLIAQHGSLVLGAAPFHLLLESAETLDLGLRHDF